MLFRERVHRLTVYTLFEDTSKEDAGSATRITPPESLTPNDIRVFVDSCDKPLTVIIDEYDRVLDKDTRRLMTDIIKMFSDYSTRCSLVLVGVSQSVEELIDAHQSITRNLDFVHVEPMGTEQLAQIIENGFGKVGLESKVD